MSIPYRIESFVNVRYWNIRPKVFDVDEAMLFSSVNELLGDGGSIASIDIDDGNISRYGHFVALSGYSAERLVRQCKS